jgi:hypothetical protein
MSYLYSLDDALVSINVPSDKARAVVHAMERDMLMQLASKAGTEAVRLALKADLENLRVVTDAKLELLRSSMTIRLGSMLVVSLGLLFTALKLT